ncbi:MAG: ATP-binding protein [Pseudonocardia sp.]
MQDAGEAGPGPKRRATIGSQLERARQRRFVGRQYELELFQSALTAAQPPYSVIHVHGPGGVGKTSLLARFSAAAAAEDVPVASVDVLHCGPSPAGLAAGIRRALELSDDDPLSAAMAGHGRAVLLLDTYEAVAAADAWVRDELLPGLPTDVLVVLAGREPPTRGWRTDAGWNELLRVVALGNLSPAECHEFLEASGVPEQLHREALEFSHGHPLALSVLAEIIDQQGPLRTLALDHEPDFIRVLLERFTTGIAAPRFRQALEACSFVRSMTESLLRVALDVDDAGELFSWLRGISFVDESPRGLVVHDLARDVINADLSWRDPKRHRQIKRRLAGYLLEEIRAADGVRQQRLFFDVMFLHRTSPEVRASYEWGDQSHVGVDPVRAEDRAHILEMTREHEGAVSAGWAEFWLDRQPQAFTAFRGRDGLLGYCCYLRVNEVDAADRDADPGTRAVWDFVQRDGSLGADEDATFLRFIMDAQRYQSPSPGFNQRATVTGQNWYSNPKLAWDFIAVQEPYPMREEFAYFDYSPVADAGFTVDRRQFLVVGHDWRRRPIAMWERLLGQRGLAIDGPRASARPDNPSGLSRPEFETAVKAALRNLNRPTMLVDNPLTRTPLVGRHPTGARSAAALAAKLRAAVESLTAEPRDQRLYRALDRTYQRPAPNQERAAEVLGLPFSTYRRHLTRGIARVTDLLWHDLHP